ncbi:DegV family protein [Candidatus Amarolinea dominans]|uniref:DegV family protein n=1 Tax=Candidatus Amarolinea dominans TaxID=3140696 RepID=UPI00313616C3|nr:DegV family protein [Anaerolineae bacterium]
MSFAIVKDSTACMPRDLLRHFQITIVPLTVTYDGVTYRDGLDIAPEKFYQRLSHVSQLPVTSPPSLESLIATYEALAETHDGILSVHLSADYSRTVDVACQAAAAVDIPVEVIDSRSVSMGTGFVVLAAAHARAAGATLVEAAATARALAPRLHVRLVVDNLRYLYLGGRIGAADRWLGAALALKPILAIEDGRTTIASTARGHRAALDALLLDLQTAAAGQKPLHVAVAHAAATRDALWLYDQIADQFDVAELHFSELSPVVGSHVGPGTVGIVYYVEA